MTTLYLVKNPTQTKHWRKAAKILFALYVRLRDSDINGNGKCSTCGKIGFIFGGEMQCGHFIKRIHSITHCDPRNAHLQCDHCNSYRGGQGEPYKMGKYIEANYGEGVPLELEELAKEGANKNYGKGFWRDLALRYASKVTEEWGKKMIEDGLLSKSAKNQIEWAKEFSSDQT